MLIIAHVDCTFAGVSLYMTRQVCGEAVGHGLFCSPAPCMKSGISNGTWQM